MKSLIDSASVKHLRDKTGAGIMDCKKALQEAGGDMDNAVTYLRKYGIATAAKKDGRVTKQGKIIASIKDKTAVMAEMLCETDFVAKTETFTGFCQELLHRALIDHQTIGDIADQVRAAESDRMTQLIARLGENIRLRRAIRWHFEGVADFYLHAGGKIGVLTELGVSNTAVDRDSEDFLHSLCMHIAAFNPAYISVEQIPEEMIRREEEIIRAQADVRTKPVEIQEKIINGRLSKWYAEICLLKQAWLHDAKKSIEQVMMPGLAIQRFNRWQLAEDFGAHPTFL